MGFHFKFIFFGAVLVLLLTIKLKITPNNQTKGSNDFISSNKIEKKRSPSGRTIPLSSIPPRLTRKSSYKIVPRLKRIEEQTPEKSFNEPLRSNRLDKLNESPVVMYPRTPLAKRGPANSAKSNKRPTADTSNTHNDKLYASSSLPNPGPESAESEVEEVEDSRPKSYTIPELYCSSSKGTGAYNGPVSLTLSCSTNSNIKFCVETGSICCDPEIDGISYTGPIELTVSGTLCLSYYGESSSNVISTVKQETYFLNVDLPEITTTSNKVFTQTTKLPGLTYLSSLDFGKSSHFAGVLNLGTHDPGPGGLNYSCEEIVQEAPFLTAPTSTQILAEVDVSTLTASSEIEISMNLPELRYGQNFVTSYIKNNQFFTPVFSCSTTEFILNDFDFFTAGSYHAAIVSPDVMELQGGFGSYGFFEANTPYRDLAGSSMEDQSGQELESGILAWLY